MYRIHLGNSTNETLGEGGTSDIFFQLDEDWASFFLMIRIEKAISAVRKKHNADNRNHPGSQHMFFFNGSAP